MPIKDKEKAREYKRLWIANKRKQNVEPVVEPVEPNLKVEPVNNFVEPANVEPLKSVKPQQVEPVEPKLNNVEPEKNVEPAPPSVEPCVEPCPFNHYSLSELFYQASAQVRQSWTEIIRQGGANQCYNCHNSQRNHQLALNLLEKYWAKVKRLQKGEKSM